MSWILNLARPHNLAKSNKIYIHTHTYIYMCVYTIWLNLHLLLGQSSTPFLAPRYYRKDWRDPTVRQHLPVPPPPRAGCHATSDVGAAGVGRLVKGCEMMTMMGISWEYPTIIGYIAGMPNFYNGISLENPTIVTMEYHGNSQLLETLLSFESCRRCRQRRVPRSLVSSGRLSWPSVLLAPGTTQLGQTVRFRTIQDH